MRLSAKHINIALLVIFVTGLLSFSPLQKLSTNLLSLLPQNKETKLLKTYEKFQSSREILVAVKSNKIEDIKKLERRVVKNNFIQVKSSFFQNKEFRDYIKKYQFYLQDFDTSNIASMQPLLQKSYQNLLSTPYYNPLNQKDPLRLFTHKKNNQIAEYKNDHIYLKDYGYMSVFTFKEGVDFQKVYDVFKNEMQNDVMIFSPMFYFVENSKAIKSQVNFLVYAAIFILMSLYVVVLKNVSLLSHTLITLFNSSILALFVVTLLWDEVSIFVMVFGIAISTIAIDYMFHHYFCGYYEQKKGFNKAVFYGFLSTFLAFFVISFVRFPFIQQVSLFSMVSLCFSYLTFAILFPKIGFKSKELNIALPTFNFLKSYKLFSLVLIAFLFYSSLHVKLDLDVKNLDYQNVELKQKEDFFKEKLQNHNKQAFIIKAKSIDSLIEKSISFKTLHIKAIVPLSNLLSKSDFMKKQELFKNINFEKLRVNLDKEAQKIGFRKGTFKNAYPKKLIEINVPQYNLELIKRYGFDVQYDGEFYYSFGFVKNTQNFDGVYLVNSAKLFEKSLNEISKELLMSGVVILVLIILILYLVTKRNFFKALCFVLFPISLTMLVLSQERVNILQIFMIFVIVSLSIDYGIYMSQKEVDKKSQRAILFSLLSTFAGFGVLIFSSIGVLFYIGEVASLGLLAILILLIVGKK